jgi:hypothetical protein
MYRLSHGIGDRGSGWIAGGAEVCLFSSASKPALEPTQPPIRWVPEALSSGVKQLGRDSNYPSPSSAEVKKDWSYNARRKQWLVLGCSANPLSEII